MNDLNNCIVKVKRACQWQAFEDARLQISVGQEYHEGAAFEATLKWARENFKAITICVNDTLQRHNFMFQGYSNEDAYALTEALGREWIERNCANIILSSVNIVRWESWRNHPDFPTLLHKMQALYNSSDFICNQVNKEIDHFWQRRLKHNANFNDSDYTRFRIHSHDYLLEECAAFSIMFAEQKAADIYPGSTLLPCSLFKGMGQYGFTRIDISENTQQVA